MVFFWGLTFRIKCTKVPLMLQAISYLGEAGRKSLGLKCSGRLWASKFLIKFHATLSSFVKQSFTSSARGFQMMSFTKFTSILNFNISTTAATIITHCKVQMGKFIGWICMHISKEITCFVFKKF